MLPFFGVLSPVTWVLSWCGWIWVLGGASLALFGSVRRRNWWSVSVFGALAVLAGSGLWALGLPQSSPDGQFRQHRNELGRLAADYRAGRLTWGEEADSALPLRLRFASIDGRAYRRCGTTDSDAEPPLCALYLPAWQNWRAENGTGIAYYPREPGPDAAIMTAAGDIGVPVKELGDGWWWVD